MRSNNPPGGYFTVLIGWVSFAALSEKDLGAPGWAKVEAFGGRWVCQGEAGVRSLGSLTWELLPEVYLPPFQEPKTAPGWPTGSLGRMFRHATVTSEVGFPPQNTHEFFFLPYCQGAYWKTNLYAVTHLTNPIQP
jgi:hypothetical protein